MKGFSLIEIMIVLVITAILASSAVVYYHQDTLRVKRIEGKIALLNLSESMEAYRFAHHTYEGANLIVLGFPEQTDHHSYRLVVADATIGGYQLEAEPFFEDAQCGVYGFNELGVKSASGAGTIRECWP